MNMRFRWNMGPQAFVEGLSELGRELQKAVGGSIGGRRHRRDVLRRRVKWYMRVHGRVELPKPVVALGDQAWEIEPPETLRIVIPRNVIAEPTSDDAADSGIVDQRKRMRRLLYAASANTKDRPFTLVNARSNRSRLPAVARRFDGPNPEARALYLDSMGIAIVPEMTPEQVEALEEAGAIVIENELVAIDDPKAENVEPVAVAVANHLAAIDIDAARAAGLTGKGVKIGVLDTGIDPTHPEFAGKQIEFMAFKPDGQRRTVKAKDYGSHGTHVSALCAGRTVGVAPDADLAVAAVLTTYVDGVRIVGYTAQILGGLDWLAGSAGLEQPVDLVNASLGSTIDVAGYHASIGAYRLAGILTVAAIGNNGVNGVGRHMAPGKLDCAIGVGAVDGKGIVAGFSDWGLVYDGTSAPATFKPDMMAPGVNVVSAVPGRRYAAKSGTSMASPLVTGAGALLIQQDEDLRNDPDALANRLLKLVEPLPAQPHGYTSDRSGNGRLVLTSIAS